MELITPKYFKVGGFILNVTKSEIVSVYEPNAYELRRFNPKICPTCPYFKGERTCLIHQSRVDIYDKIKNIYSISYLDLENPYKQKKDCNYKISGPRFLDKSLEYKNKLEIKS